MRVFSIHAMNTMNKNIIFIKYEDFVILKYQNAYTL